MPLAYHGRLVAGGLQKFGGGLLTSIEGGGVVGEPIGMAMLAGEHTGTAGTADGVGHKTIGETHSVFGNAVDIGGLDEAIVVCADGLIGMIIAHDIDDVHGTWSRFGCVRFFITTSRQGGDCGSTGQ